MVEHSESRNSDVDDANVPTLELLLDLHEAGADVDVYVHDTSRLAWNMTVPIESRTTTKYTFELELEIPSNVFANNDPCPTLKKFGCFGNTT